MTCVVFGGSGQIGHFLMPRLLARGTRTVAFSRQPQETTGSVLWVRGQLPDAIAPMRPPVRAIISLGPLDHFATWLAQADVGGAPRVVAMSSMSAESKVDSPDAAERELAARLQAAERRLLARCAQLGCACTILRATLIYGAGLDHSLSRLTQFAQRWRVFPLLRGRGLRQPVHAEDLALAVLAALDCPRSAGQVLPIGGGERLSASAMFARVRANMCTRTLPVALPRSALRLASSLTGRGRGMVARLSRDLIADNAEMIRLLGVQPRGFMPPAAPLPGTGCDAPGNCGSDNQN